MPTDLTQLEALARAATPGEWSVGQDEYDDCTAIYVVAKKDDGETTVAQLEYWNGRGEANATYIAAADPAAILALIEETRRQQQEIAALRLTLGGRTFSPTVPEPVGCPMPGACAQVAEIARLRDENAALVERVRVADGTSYQKREDQWLVSCFGSVIARDKTERNHRFLEESLELAQSCECTATEAHQLVDYVFGRPIGEPAQEVGGVMNTLAALCTAADIDMMIAAEVELVRCWEKAETIRAKQKTKPKYGPLPGDTP